MGNCCSANKRDLEQMEEGLDTTNVIDILSSPEVDGLLNKSVERAPLSQESSDSSVDQEMIAKMLAEIKDSD